MVTLGWIIVSFFCGAIPFSILIGKLALRTDIRQYGDGNPGGTNVARAGNWQLGVLAIFLDMMKGALPVGAAWYFGHVSGLALVPVALAPILGHAYSPFLGFKGGKAIAVTGGIWGGLTLGEAPLIMALFLLLWVVLLAVDGWAVMATLVSFLAYLLLKPTPDLTLILIWAGSALIIAWKHRTDLQERPRLRNWIHRQLSLLRK